MVCFRDIIITSQNEEKSVKSVFLIFFAGYIIFGIAKSTIEGFSYSRANTDQQVAEVSKRSAKPTQKGRSLAQTQAAGCGGERGDVLEASWYGPGFHGRQMANGDRYNQYAMTVAHRTLPFGTTLCIKNPENGVTVVAKVTDRGPYESVYRPGKAPRDIDLSKGVADKLGVTEQGIARVVVTRI